MIHPDRKRPATFAHRLVTWAFALSLFLPSALQITSGGLGFAWDSPALAKDGGGKGGGGSNGGSGGRERGEWRRWGQRKRRRSRNGGGNGNGGGERQRRRQGNGGGTATAVVAATETAGATAAARGEAGTPAATVMAMRTATARSARERRRERQGQCEWPHGHGRPQRKRGWQRLWRRDRERPCEGARQDQGPGRNERPERDVNGSVEKPRRSDRQCHQVHLFAAGRQG